MILSKEELIKKYYNIDKIRETLTEATKFTQSEIEHEIEILTDFYYNHYLMSIKETDNV